MQDRGRFGYRQYGIPQSGAMDPVGMQIANRIVGNDDFDPIIEYALSGIHLEAREDGIVGLFGASLYVNEQLIRENGAYIKKGDIIKLSPPQLVYAYFSLSGFLDTDFVFGSYATYLPGRFGGFKGRSLMPDDEITSRGKGVLQSAKSRKEPGHSIRFIMGPEWEEIKTPFSNKEFQIASSSNRIGIRLQGDPLQARSSEIKSSAVIPGTIQLPPNGQPIVLMNDCQTTGGYPRIGKVLDEDLGKLAQQRPNQRVNINLCAIDV